ncbi:hypothetical protein DN402_01610 [Streptomyces sp. SW4]|nr:hypothetical protein DN402_01610 [Streptomyces sp. SW4]
MHLFVASCGRSEQGAGRGPVDRARARRTGLRLQLPGLHELGQTARRAFSFCAALGFSVSKIAFAASRAEIPPRPAPASATRSAVWCTVVVPVVWSCNRRNGPTSANGCFR